MVFFSLAVLFAATDSRLAFSLALWLPILLSGEINPAAERPLVNSEGTLERMAAQSLNQSAMKAKLDEVKGRVLARLGREGTGQLCEPCGGQKFESPAKRAVLRQGKGRSHRGHRASPRLRRTNARFRIVGGKVATTHRPWMAVVHVRRVSTRKETGPERRRKTEYS